MKPEIYTPKISKKFETVYYYRQKFVNWEFVAPSGYMSLIVVPTDNKQIRNHNNVISRYSALYPYGISLYKYATEDSYQLHNVYYEITSSNLDIDYTKITINSITCLNENIDLYINQGDVLDSTIEQVKYTTLIYNDTSALAIFSNQDIIECDLTFVIFSATYNKKIKHAFKSRIAPINLHSNVIITPKLKYNKLNVTNNIRTLVLSNKVYMRFLNGCITTIDNSYTDCNEPYSNTIIFSNEKLNKNGVHSIPKKIDAISIPTIQNLTVHVIKKTIGLIAFDSNVTI